MLAAHQFRFQPPSTASSATATAPPAAAPHAVPAPQRPLIPDDQHEFTFSRYISQRKAPISHSQRHHTLHLSPTTPRVPTHSHTTAATLTPSTPPLSSTYSASSLDSASVSTPFSATAPPNPYPSYPTDTFAISDPDVGAEFVPNHVPDKNVSAVNMTSMGTFAFSPSSYSELYYAMGRKEPEVPAKTQECKEQEYQYPQLQSQSQDQDQEYQYPQSQPQSQSQSPHTTMNQMQDIHGYDQMQGQGYDQGFEQVQSGYDEQSYHHQEPQAPYPQEPYIPSQQLLPPQQPCSSSLLSHATTPLHRPSKPHRPSTRDTFRQPPPPKDKDSHPKDMKHAREAKEAREGKQGKEAKKPAGACTRCKRMKMKCVPTDSSLLPAQNTHNPQFPDAQTPSHSHSPCQRCMAGGYECVVEGRKPRTPSRREWLLAQIRQKDAQIAALLRAARANGGGGVSMEERTPLVLAGGRIVAEMNASNNAAGGELSATDRAALIAAEKGAGSAWGVGVGVGTGAGTGLSGVGGGGASLPVRYRARVRERKWGVGLKNEGGVKVEGRGGDAGSDMGDSDEEWSSDGSGGSGWDGAVEAAFVADKARVRAQGHVQSAYDSGGGGVADTGASTGRLYLHSLPQRDAPLGLIARLSLEESPVSSSGTELVSPASMGLGEDDAETVVGKGRGKARGVRVGVKRTRGGDVGDGGEDADMEGEDGEDADEAMERGVAQEESDAWGIANKSYFQPGPTSNVALRRVLNAREAPPPIMASGLVSWSEAERLFEIFYENLSPFVSVLDPVLHTVSSVYERCPFLFTVVIAISSRYLPSRPGLHKIAMHFAKTSAAMAFVDGEKSVEVAQAYLLMSAYGLPARRWEEDRSWFYGGLASRVATDLGLHRASTTKPLSEHHERELLNRARTWLNCFNIDRSSATQWGKPMGLQEDGTVRSAKTWHRRSRYNHPYDVHLVGFTELLRIMWRFHEQVYSDPKAPTGLNKNCDFRALTEHTEAELSAWYDDLSWSYANESDPNDPGSVVRTNGVPIYVNYMRLVMYAFGFEAAWKRHGVEPGDMFFAKCLQSATTVVKQLTDVYAPSGYLKYAPDCYFVMGGFCAAFMLKMLRPEFGTLLDEEQRTRIVALVTRFVEVLASPQASIDEMHTPKLYAKFLHGQLRYVTVTPQQTGASTPVSAPAAATVSVSSTPQRDASLLSSPGTLHSEPDSRDALPTPYLDMPPVFSHSTPSAHSTMSSAGSSIPTPGPEQEPDVAPHHDAWLDSSTEGGGSQHGGSGSGSGSGSASGGSVAGGSIAVPVDAATATAVECVPDDPMELCEGEFLATMQAISSEQWLNSVLMPGFRWPMEEPMPLGQQGELIFGGGT